MEALLCAPYAWSLMTTFYWHLILMACSGPMCLRHCREATEVLNTL